MTTRRQLLQALSLAPTLLGAARASEDAASAPTAAACPVPAALSDGWAADAPEALGFDAARLCAVVAAFQASTHNLHGLVVERGGRLVAESYRRGADVPWLLVVPRQVAFGPTTRHDMRSISKSVTSLLWGIADTDVGLPPVQTPVLELFPELRDLATGGRERITIEDLLAMRSGLAWDEAGRYGSAGNDENGLAWRSDIPRYVFGRTLATPPGSHFNYNGGHTAVLTQLIEARTGATLPAYAQRRLFEPLGITEWDWGTDLRGRARAYAGLRLRPRDLLRIGRLVLDGGSWQGRQVVPTSWLQASFAPRLPDGESALGPGGNYGYQWWLGTVIAGERRIAYHAGVGNGGQRLFLVPELDVAVALTAGEYNDPRVGSELRRLLRSVLEAVVPRG